MVRGLPTEPAASLSERVRALRYFINNFAPGLRDSWIRYSDRVCVGEFMRDDLPRLGPNDHVLAPPLDSPTPRGVVLDANGVLLGAIEQLDTAPRALDAMNPSPQTIRPDMTPRLAKALMASNPYILVTTEMGKYLGRYVSPPEYRS